MAEGLKILHEIYRVGRKQLGLPAETYLGINAAVIILSDPRNKDLLQRLIDYCKEGEE